MLQIATFDGAPGGMNAARASHEIGDDQARFLIDFLVDKPGLTRGRGPLTYATGVYSPTEYGIGLFQTIDPSGAHRVGLVQKDGGDALFTRFLNSTYAAEEGTHSLALSAAGQSADFIVDAKPALSSGTLLGVLSQYEPGSSTVLAFWKGGRKSSYTTGTVTCTNAGGAVVTGSGTSWSANVTPGMFLLNGSGHLVGCIRSVDSDTQVTLEEVPLHDMAAAAYSIVPLRGLRARAMKGRITTSTSSALVDGFNTKFQDQMSSGSWLLYRAKDKRYIGQVTSIQDNENLTLTGNAGVALTDERYVGIQLISVASITSPALGPLTASYADRQWYIGSDSKLRFSDITDREAVDMSETDGDFIPVPSTGGAITPPKALVAAYNSLLVLKESEVYAVFGQSPSNFDLRKIADDGALSGMSAVAYGGGVLYAGKNGIYLYDGQSVDNLVEATLGDYYRSSVRTFNPKTHRMWGMVERDHYLLHIESVTPPHPILKGNVSTELTRFTVCIHLPSRAVTLMTNVDIRGALQLPASLGRSSWFLVNNSSSDARICNAADLFDSSGRDAAACVGNTAGPNFYIESKRYPMGNHLLKKLWKQMILTYQVTGDNLKLDTVLGLNEPGAVAGSEWETSTLSWQDAGTLEPSWDAFKLRYSTWDGTGSSLLLTKRIKFLKRSTHIAFRIYPKSTNVTAVILGPWQLGFKEQRAGRI